MKKFTLKSFTCLSAALLISASAPAQSSSSIQLLEANLTLRSWNQEEELFTRFAENSEQACQQWSPSAFDINKNLRESCQFPGLFKQYKSLLSDLDNPDQGGLTLPQVSLSDAQIPLLAAGVWQRVVFAEREGSEVAINLILLRLALEKSLESHAKLIWQNRGAVKFNEFSLIVVPRMIASFSAYSQTLRTLRLLERIDCDRAATQACNEVLDRASEVKEQVLLGVGTNNFLEGLNRLHEANSGRNILKAKAIFGLAKTLKEIRQTLSLAELVDAIDNNSSHVLIERLKAEYSGIADGLGSLNNQEMAEMLTAVFILSEISEAQSIRDEEVRNGEKPIVPGPISQNIRDEMNQLKSYVLKVLSVGESVK